MPIQYYTVLYCYHGNHSIVYRPKLLVGHSFHGNGILNRHYNFGDALVIYIGVSLQSQGYPLTPPPPKGTLTSTMTGNINTVILMFGGILIIPYLSAYLHYLIATNTCVCMQNDATVRQHDATAKKHNFIYNSNATLHNSNTT